MNAQSLPAKHGTTSARFAFADGLRGLAALWVVLYHLSEGHHIDRLKAILPAVINQVVFEAGGLGVPIFFVLSGFVMAYTTRNAQVNGHFAGQFLLRRLIRLTPPYWFAIVFALLFVAIKQRAMPGQVLFPSLTSITAHFFYVQDLLGFKQINPVFWTLCVELQFYIAFAVMVWLADTLTKKFNTSQARVWVAAVSALIALPWALGWLKTPLWHGGFIGFWFCFMAGVLACWALFGQARFRGLCAMYLAVLLLAFASTHSLFALMSFATASALYWAGARQKMADWLNWRWLQFIGLVSYSLYLLHNPLTGASANIVRRFFAPSLATDIIVFCAGLAICLGVAWVAYRLIELPSIAWSHRIKPTNQLKHTA